MVQPGKIERPEHDAREVTLLIAHGISQVHCCFPADSAKPIISDRKFHRLFGPEKITPVAKINPAPHRRTARHEIAVGPDQPNLRRPDPFVDPALDRSLDPSCLRYRESLLLSIASSVF